MDSFFALHAVRIKEYHCLVKRQAAFDAFDTMRFQKKLADQTLLRYSRATLAHWYWSTQVGLENFERGEVVSPRGSIASKVSGPNLATPDARHRRPLKIFQYPSRCFKLLSLLLVCAGTCFVWWNAQSERRMIV
jgi:hypothetical protein